MISPKGYRRKGTPSGALYHNTIILDRASFNPERCVCETPCYLAQSIRAFKDTTARRVRQRLLLSFMLRDADRGLPPGFRGGSTKSDRCSGLRSSARLRSPAVLCRASTHPLRFRTRALKPCAILRGITTTASLIKVCTPFYRGAVVQLRLVKSWCLAWRVLFNERITTNKG